MKTTKPANVLIISSVSGEACSGNILGTGGWLPPEEREALDWLTLVTFLGWKARLITSGDLSSAEMEDPDLRVLILTGELNAVEKSCLDRLLEKVHAGKVLLIARVGVISDARWPRQAQTLLSGKHLEWIGAGKSRKWQGRQVITVPKLELNGQESIWATLDGQPIIAGKQLGAGQMALLSFHPSAMRDEHGIFSALLKHLLVWWAGLPAVCLDWSNTVVLRMDDPGSAQTVHHDAYNNTNKLGPQEWSEIGKILETYQARLSIGYVPGWVDDGDPGRGQLLVDGQTPKREPGNIYPSPKVQYTSTNQDTVHIRYDYAAEFNGIQELRHAGLAEVELHGYTHIYPDKARWHSAQDKYSNSAWYREFSRQAVPYLESLPPGQHPLQAGRQAFFAIFNKYPGTLICPGDEFTNEVLEKALQLNFSIVSSYYQCIRVADRFCWVQHVCAPYLDRADPAWFDAELPVIGYFHDFDLSIHGTEWLARCLADWERAGAQNFIDFQAVADKLNCHTSEQPQLTNYI